MYFFTDRFFFFEISHCIFINSISFAHPVFVPIVSKKKLFKKEAVSLTVPFAARWFLLFGLFAFLGWCCETAYCSFFSRRFSNNALLHVPFSPLYGAGGLCAAALGLAVKKTAALFFACMAVCAALEYIVGALLEAVCGRKFWDYSGQRFSFRGRICLKNALLFGLMGVLAARPVPAAVDGVDPAPAAGLSCAVRRTGAGASFRPFAFPAKPPRTLTEKRSQRSSSFYSCTRCPSFQPSGLHATRSPAPNPALMAASAPCSIMTTTSRRRRRPRSATIT